MTFARYAAHAPGRTLLLRADTYALSLDERDWFVGAPTERTSAVPEGHAMDVGLGRGAVADCDTTKVGSNTRTIPQDNIVRIMLHQEARFLRRAVTPSPHTTSCKIFCQESQYNTHGSIFIE